MALPLSILATCSSEACHVESAVSVRLGELPDCQYISDKFVDISQADVEPILKELRKKTRFGPRDGLLEFGLARSCEIYMGVGGDPESPSLKGDKRQFEQCIKSSWVPHSNVGSKELWNLNAELEIRFPYYQYVLVLLMGILFSEIGLHFDRHLKVVLPVLILLDAIVLLATFGTLFLFPFVILLVFTAARWWFKRRRSTVSTLG